MNNRINNSSIRLAVGFKSVPGELEVEIIGAIVEGADIVFAVVGLVVFDMIVDAVAVGLCIGPLNRLKVEGSVRIRKCLFFYPKVLKITARDTRIQG